MRVKTGDSRWGDLFHSIGGSSNANISGLQRGTISAVGGGLSIRCEYVTTGTLQGGFGFC